MIICISRKFKELYDAKRFSRRLSRFISEKIFIIWSDGFYFSVFPLGPLRADEGVILSFKNGVMELYE